MLVLSRRAGEKICIGNGIVITIVAAVRNKVRVGVEAPLDVPVDRAEVRQQKEAAHEEEWRSDVLEALPR